jgi:hypothetical protein
VTPDRDRPSVWWDLLLGMRAYGVAITVVWAMSAFTVLGLLAIVIPGPWSHLGFGGGAVAELGLSLLTLRFLRRASVRGHFDH